MKGGINKTQGIVILIAIIAFLVIFGPNLFGYQMRGILKGLIDGCQKNADCVRVNTGCCGCSSADPAINKNYVWLWGLTLEKLCICPMMIRPCPPGEPVCVSGKCEMKYENLTAIFDSDCQENCETYCRSHPREEGVVWDAINVKTKKGNMTCMKIIETLAWQPSEQRPQDFEPFCNCSRWR